MKKRRRNKITDEKRLLYLGKVFHTTMHGDVEIIEYNAYVDVTIKFLNTGTIRNNVRIDSILSGQLKDPSLTMYGGYCSDPKKYYGSKYECAKQKWESMLARCYSGRYPDYSGCTVCEEWMDLANFAEWYTREDCGRKQSIDKDIVCTGNRVYCPEKCIVVPFDINRMFIHKNSKNKNARDQDLPSGICRAKTKQIGYIVDFNAKLLFGGRTTGVYPDLKLACYVLKTFREMAAKNVAEKYKKVLNKRAYDALINYKENIDICKW